MEQEFKDNFIGNKKIQGKFILIGGVKGSGKSYAMTQYIKLSMAHKVYDLYILILPAYNIEASNTYKFLNIKDKHVFIGTDYHEGVTQLLMKKVTGAPKNKKPRILFCIDDSSAEQLDHHKMDHSMKKFITSIRHYNTDLIVVAHATNSIISPFLRGQIDILILYKMTNYKLLKTIYEEFLSLSFDKLKEFIEEYKNNMKEEYNCVYINLRNQKIFLDFKKLVGRFNV